MQFKLDRLGRFNLNRRIKAVLPYIEGDLLDVGCGGNELVRSYSGNGIGIDVYPWDNVDIVVKDSSDLPFEDKKFDTVSIIAALNHIPNRNAVLKETDRVLKDDGKLIITMLGPKFSKFWHFIRKKSDPDQHQRGVKHEEVWGFTIEQLRDLLSQSGFGVVLSKKFQFRLNSLIIAKKNSENN